MWTRAQLKQNGMFHFKKNYWKCVLAALILLFVGGGMGTVGGSGSYKSNQEDIEKIMNGDLSGLTGTVTDDPAMFAALMGTIAIVFIIVFLVVMAVAIALDVFVFNPLQVGAQRYFVANHYQENTELSELTFGFKANYRNVTLTMFFMDLFVFLWTLLFIVPGIIKSYAYRLVPYILTEHPDMEWKDALALSESMMNGQKWNAFVLDLSFIGWFILSGFTLGILGIFYVNPYKYATDTELYVAIKETTGAMNSIPQ